MPKAFPEEFRRDVRGARSLTSIRLSGSMARGRLACLIGLSHVGLSAIGLARVWDVNDDERPLQLVFDELD